MRSNGGFLGAKKTISPSAASGIWSARDVQREVGATHGKQRGGIDEEVDFTVPACSNPRDNMP
jgi:hypothetical protein